MIRVLIVDDSQTSRLLLQHIIDATPDMTVVGELANGAGAVEKVQSLRPDVILMDVVMPHMDGLDATQAIMAQFPTPIVMISGATHGPETNIAFQAIKRGALMLLSKPDGPDHPDFEKQSAYLVSMLRAMAGVRVIHHYPPRQAKPAPQKVPQIAVMPARPDVIGIVASTGGPAALAEIFQAFPADFSLPIVVVQHINIDFQRSLIKWMKTISALPIRLAKAGHTPEPGITLAPGGKHLIIDVNRQFAFTDKPQHSHMPSGDVLLSSLASTYGDAAAGIVLTGMGADGALGLRDIYQRGGLTIAQDELSSAVYGMPQEAKRLGAVHHELSLNLIAPLLRKIAE